eukprot:14641017-Alexandrium_andersonii.AAC.1
MKAVAGPSSTNLPIGRCIRPGGLALPPSAAVPMGQRLSVLLRCGPRSPTWRARRIPQRRGAGGPPGT